MIGVRARRLDLLSELNEQNKSVIHRFECYSVMQRYRVPTQTGETVLSVRTILPSFSQNFPQRFDSYLDQLVQSL